MEMLKNKLQSQTGESLAETLVAVLVIALALTMLAGMITATANVVKRSETTMNNYYKENVKLEKLETEQSMSISVTSDELNVEISVDYEDNRTFSKYPVIAYRVKE